MEMLLAPPWEVLPASSLASSNSLEDAEQNPLSCPWIHNRFTLPFSHPNLGDQAPSWLSPSHGLHRRHPSQ